MAGDAIPLRHRANFCARIRSQVALLALAVVRRTVLLQLPMRIVTGNAGDPRVGRIIAAAVSETVELEADIGNSPRPVGRNISPTRMTFAA